MKSHGAFLKAIQLDPLNRELRKTYVSFLKRLRDEQRVMLIENSLQLETVHGDDPNLEELKEQVLTLSRPELQRWYQVLTSNLGIDFRPSITFLSGLPFCLHVQAKDSISESILGKTLQLVPFSSVDLTEAELSECRLRALLNVDELKLLWELRMSCVDCENFPVTALAATRLDNIQSLLVRNPDENQPLGQGIDLEILLRSDWISHLVQLSLYNHHVTFSGSRHFGDEISAPVEILTFDNCVLDNEVARALAFFSPTLEALDLSCSRFRNGFWYKLFHLEEATFPKLRRLNLSDADIDVLDFESFPSLEVLELQSAPRSLLNCLVNSDDCLLQLKRLAVRDHDLSPHDFLMGKIEERFDFVEWV